MIIGPAKSLQTALLCTCAPFKTKILVGILFSYALAKEFKVTQFEFSSFTFFGKHHQKTALKKCPSFLNFAEVTKMVTIDTQSLFDESQTDSWTET